jgi:4-hydroxybenzoate polyprenyltransferase
MAAALTWIKTAAVQAGRWTRSREWTDSKLAWLGTACYYLALANAWPVDRLAGVMARVVPFVICLAAFGYAVNDYCDRDADAAAGKDERSCALGRTGQRGLILILLVATLLAAVPLAVRPAALAGGAALFALAVAYSARPWRLKIRGAWGLLASATAQWGTPVLPLLVGGAAPTPGFALLFALGLSVGVRWMLLHQVLDASGDVRAGLRTFTVEGGVPRSTTILRGLVGFEAGLLAVWMLTDGRAAPALAVAAGAYLLIGGMVALRRGRGLPPAAPSYERAPLRGLYLAWLPLSFLVSLIAVHPAYAWVAAADLWWRRYQWGTDLRLLYRAVRRPST